MLVQPAGATPERVPRARRRAAREAVEPPADQMARRVAGEAVARERAGAREQHERPDADADRRAVAQRVDDVPPEEEQVRERRVEEVPVEVLQDEREGGLAAIAVA